MLYFVELISLTKLTNGDVNFVSYWSCAVVAFV